MSKILNNIIRCNKCGDTIESRHVHDFVYCRCQACAVDGGREYLKRIGKKEDWQDLSLVAADDYVQKEPVHPKTKSAIQHMKLEEE